MDESRYQLKIPKGYRPRLGIAETERAIKFLKDTFENRLADALILEGVCLAVLVPSCAGKCRRWAFISGGTALGVALYVTRSFWLSISWWVYLLAAGIGLILFAARNEMKKR